MVLYATYFKEIVRPYHACRWITMKCGYLTGVYCQIRTVMNADL